MGELLPCPFCGSSAKLVGIRDGQQVSCTGHRCFASGPAVFHGPGGWEACEREAITAWNTRPRTEGRGDEPVASDKALFDALWELVAAMANEGIPQTPRTKAAFKIAHQTALDRLRKDWSSPIREPEISRVSLDAAKRSSDRLNAFVSDAMNRGVDAARSVRERCTLEECPPGLFVADAYNTLGMKTEYHTDKGAVEAYIVESGEFFWGDNPQTVERQRAQIVRPISHADAILNLAPVEGWAISKDGPHKISDTRKWLARQLLDSKLDEAEALGIVAFSPAITDLAPVGGREEEGSSRSQDPSND